MRDHPDEGEFTLDRLEEVGAIIGTDREILAKAGAQYFPFSADSPGDQVVFVRTRTNGETRYFRSYSPQVLRRLTSPDGLLEIADLPPGPRTEETYVRTLRTTDANVALLRYESEGHLVGEPQWRGDSKAVAMLESCSQPDRKRELVVLMIDGNQVVKVMLPAALDPRDAVPPRYLQAYSLHWDQQAIIDKFSWKQDVLQFHWVCAATVVQNGVPNGTISFNYYLDATFDATGEISIVGKKSIGIQGRRNGKLFNAQI